MLKRIFSILITVVLCLNAIPVSAWNTERTPQIPNTVSQFEPSFTLPDSDFCIEEIALPERTAQTQEDDPQYPGYDYTPSGMEAAAGYYKDKVRNRVSEWGFSVNMDKVYAVNDEAGFAVGRQIYDEIKRLVIKHTGEPDAGDYLIGGARTYKMTMWRVKDSATGEISIVKFDYVLSEDDYYTTKAQEDQLAAAIEELINELDLRSPYKSDYEKVSAVYDWMVYNIRYDREHLSQGSSYKIMYTAYGGMIDKKCVCMGYALLFYRIMLTIGIDSRYLAGWPTEEGFLTQGNGNKNTLGGSHAWNIVCLNGEYYLLDSTWDSCYYEPYVDNPSEYKGHSLFALGTDSSFGERIYNEYCDEIMSSYPVSRCSYADHMAARSGGVAPTCTSQGSTGHGVCQKCGAVLADFEIPKIDHDYGENGVCKVCGYNKNAFLLGDLDSSGGNPDISDGVIMQRILAHIEDNSFADLNGDGFIDVNDGIVMQRILAGIQ